MRPSAVNVNHGRAAVVLTLLACSLFALSLPPVPDHGYQFYLGSRLLEGARLYVDVAAADMHPPLFTWLAASLEAVARLIGLSGLTLFPGFVVLCVAGAVYAVSRLAPPSSFVLLTLVIILLPFSGAFFGQGEHLALILSLPYLAAAAPPDDRPLRPAARIAIAAAAAFGLAMKPYFALVWLGVEAYRARRRGWQSLWRIESILIGAFFLLYVALTALITPEFFRLLPWLSELYPRYAHKDLLDLVFDWRTLLLLTGQIAGRFVRAPEWRPLADLLSIAALAMFSAMLLQSKGWGYHWYPVSALALLLCALAVRRYLERFRLIVPALAFAAAAAMYMQVDRTARLLAGPPTFLPELMEVVDQQARGQHVLVLSQLLHPGFPLVNFTGAGFTSPYAHLWMIPAMYAESWYGNAPMQYRAAGKWKQLEQEMFDRIWQQTERTNPALTIMDAQQGNGFDMRSYFSTDARFRARFEQSPSLGTAGRYTILGRPGRR